MFRQQTLYRSIHSLSNLSSTGGTKLRYSDRTRRTSCHRSRTVAYAGNEEVPSHVYVILADCSNVYCYPDIFSVGAQISKLREKLDAIARELETSNKDTFLSSVAAERAAELAALPLKEPPTTVTKQASDTAPQKAESHGKLKTTDRKPKKQMKPKVNELEDAEKKPKLFEPAAGPPPKVGEEELQAEGSGHEILLQVYMLHQPWCCITLHDLCTISGHACIMNA